MMPEWWTTVILVKSDYDSQAVLLDNYTLNLFLDIAGSTVYFTRGFGIVDVDIKGTEFRFVNTHLEVRGEPGSIYRVVQYAQMQELVMTIAESYWGDPSPIILVGDLNSSPEDEPGDGPNPYGGTAIRYTPPYMLATQLYDDTWLMQENPNKYIYDDGNTSGFEETIDDPLDTLETRIDHILLYPDNLDVKKSRCEVVGDDPGDMVPNDLTEDPYDMLWPSDHAGVTARLMFK